MSNDRARVLREIQRNAALAARRDMQDVSVRVMPDARAGFVAEASVAGGDQTFRAQAEGEDEAAWSLLMLVVDAAHGAPVTQSLMMTPALRKSIRLLQLTRTELIEEIRRELDANPIADDDEID